MTPNRDPGDECDHVVHEPFIPKRSYTEPIPPLPQWILDWGSDDRPEA